MKSAREQALDPTRSFLVQAPAGSGKTELLVQRYLRLLADVRQPEQVIAITFTRKAAAEMRSRILEMLQRASEPGFEFTDHRQQTLALARAVLATSRARRWSLVEQPQRLRIQTVDALNADLAQQLPAAAGGASAATVIENAKRLYLRAARNCVERALGDRELQADVVLLIELAGYSIQRLEETLASLLPARDQWQAALLGADSEELAAEVETGLSGIATQMIETCRAIIGAENGERLRVVLAPVADARPELQHWLSEPASGAEEALSAWRAVADLLLTRSGTWRRRFGKAEGFGPDRRAERAELDGLLAELTTQEDLREQLRQIRDFPDPNMSEPELEALRATSKVLRALLAELMVISQELELTDFEGMAQAAARALGASDAPSDLLLALDQRIEHILVDEFQDTSHAQFELLELLTSGWTPGDGRTLFLVGDPMQSIYRFRNADMRLMLRARHRGLGDVRLDEIRLDDNFRSAPVIVGWINGTFASLFGHDDDLSAGIAGYASCRAVRAGSAGQSVQIHGLPALADEQETVVSIVRDEAAKYPARSIAILVQSRTHVRGLAARLVATGLQVNAIEIEGMAEHAVIQDLVALTRALTHPADRTAWLALLRAPWCGLRWEALERLCGSEPDTPIWTLMHEDQLLERIGPDGQRRLLLLRKRLGHAFRARSTMALPAWIEHCWQLLDGPLCCQSTNDMTLVRAFFEILDGVVEDNDLFEPVALIDALQEPLKGTTQATSADVEIMTIHRAKGLEFDTVVLFGLGRVPRASEAGLLNWHVHEDRSGQHLLLAPNPSRSNKLHRLVMRHKRQHDVAERSRLLYVAATRARERLHLVATLPDQNEPASGTLLAALWPRYAEAFRQSTSVEGMNQSPDRPPSCAPEVAGPNWLKRFDVTNHDPWVIWPDASLDVASTDTSERFEWVSPVAVHVGTQVHRELCRAAEATEAEREPDGSRLRRELRLLGVADSDLEEAVSRVRDVLSAVFSDPMGRWILEPHAEAQSELKLSEISDERLVHLQLDRTFVDPAGTRWIIDYKTSRHSGSDLEQFVAAELERYRDQLNRYAHAMARLDERPIRVALYFPLLGVFRDWVPD